ncbi:MAG: hypothetical protein ABIZ95_02030 [Pyrinomonadaceae bacterium]
METPKQSRDGYTIIFVKSFRHYRTGKIIRRPDGKAFPIRIRVKPNG